MGCNEAIGFVSENSGMRQKKKKIPSVDDGGGVVYDGSHSPRSPVI